jgi:hypothetical protein
MRVVMKRYMCLVLLLFVVMNFVQAGERYVDKQAGYSCRLPALWVARKLQGSEYNAISGPVVEGDKPLVCLTKDTYPGTIDGYLIGAKEGLRKEAKWEISKTEILKTSSGFRAGKISGSIFNGKVRLKAYAYCVQVKDKIFMFICYAMTDKFEKQFDAIIKSFNVVKK